MFPDPLSDTLVSARAWAQSHAPKSAVVYSVSRIHSPSTIWNIYYKLDLPPSEHKTVRSIFQRCYGSQAVVKTVQYIEMENGNSCWSVTSTKSSVSVWDYVRNKIRPSRQNKDLICAQKVKTTLSQVSNQIKVEVKRNGTKIRIPIKEYSDTDLPFKLYQNDTNVTHKYINRTTLTKRLFESIQNQIGVKTPEEIRNSVKIQVRENKNKHSLRTIEFVKSSSPVTDIQQVTPIPKVYSAIPYSYDNSVYHKSKLRDTRTFTAVRRYLIQVQGIPGCGTFKIKPSITNIELANQIAAEGLQPDESLLKLYVDYCNERHLVKDAIAELTDYANSIRQ